MGTTKENGFLNPPSGRHLWRPRKVTPVFSSEVTTKLTGKARRVGDGALGRVRDTVHGHEVVRLDALLPTRAGGIVEGGAEDERRGGC